MPTLSGQVKIEDTGYPAANLEIIVYQPAEAPRPIRNNDIRLAAGLTDSSGRFTLDIEPNDSSLIYVAVNSPRLTREQRPISPKQLYVTPEPIDLSEGPQVLSILLSVETMRELGLPVSQMDEDTRKSKYELDSLNEAEPIHERLARVNHKRRDAVERRIREETFIKEKQTAEVAFKGFRLQRKSMPIHNRENILPLNASKTTATQRLEVTTDVFLDKFSQSLPAIPIRMSSNLLNKIGIGADERIDKIKLNKALASSETPLIYDRRQSFDAILQTIECKQQGPNDNGTDTDTESPNECRDQAIDEITTEQLSGRILNLLDTQIADISTCLSSDKQRHTASSLGESLSKFSVPVGPADVPAFYDFPTLQVTKQELRTILPDEGIKSLSAELMGLFRLKMAEINLPIPSISITEIDALETFLDQIDSFLQREFTIEREECIGEACSKTFYTSSASLETDYDSHHLVRLRNLYNELYQRLHGTYEFEVAHPDDVNFGLIINYRQHWEPLQYQVGELVGTVPLAPGESRKTTIRHIVKTKRSEQAIDQSIESRRFEQDTKTSASSDITARAQEKSNFGFKASVSGGFFGLGKWSTETSYSNDKSRDSQKKKRTIRDATRKAAEEYKRDRKVQITIDEEFIDEETTEAKLSNPNNEIPVTYLFYELQRRYRVSERIQSVEPVVLIPMPVPRPDQITDAWILRHDWIIRRVLLDDQYLDALEYLRNGLSGDLAQLSVLEKQFLVRLDAIKRIQTDVEVLQAKVRMLQGKITRSGKLGALAKRGYLLDEDDLNSFPMAFNKNMMSDYAKNILEEELRSGELPETGIDDSRVWEALAEAASQSLNYSQDELSDLRAHHAALTVSFEDAQDIYRKALVTYFRKTTKILQLRNHVRDNILYYMQAIWNHEPPDQRWMKLQGKTIPDFEIEPTAIDIKSIQAPEVTLGSVGLKLEDGKLKLQSVGGSSETKIASGIGKVVRKATIDLVDVADIDNPIGYHGNYLILRLREPNALTQYMMSEYYCEALGVCDPDPFGNATPDELKQIADCLENQDQVPVAHEDMIKELRRMADGRIQQGDDSEIIVVPSEHIYIEALPGAHPVLEDFKLKHRAIDVVKARAEVRQIEIDNLRRAGRIASDNFEDAGVDKQVVIKGSTTMTTVPVLIADD